MSTEGETIQVSVLP